MMLRMLTISKDFTSIDDSVTSYDAPRPLDFGKLEERIAVSPLPSPRTTSLRWAQDLPVPNRGNTGPLNSNPTGHAHVAAPSDVPTLIKTPWELGRSKRSGFVNKPLPRPRTPVLPDRFFKFLPREVYDCILAQLRTVHLDGPSIGCLSCYLKDLNNLALTSRAWDRATRTHLYENIWLMGSDFQQELAPKKSKLANRVQLLRRTLRGRSPLARLVKVLNVQGLQSLYDVSSPREKDQILNIAASLVMACPNLEALRGFYPTTDHHFDRLSHALASRKMLKERVYILNDEKPRLLTTRPDEASQILFYQYENPTETFLEQSDRWLSLQTLILHGQRPGCMNFRSFIANFRKLPSLQNLAISSFHANDFDDRTLQALPNNIVSLRLQNLPGLSDKGILRFASSPAAASIQNLALIDLEITYLHAIRQFFQNLPLRRFTIQQTSSPCLMPGATLPSPVFVCPTLEYLHWDILIPGSINDSLAHSISAGAFPSLRTIRSPSDHYGLLQDLCRPIAQAVLDTDPKPSPAEDARVDSPFEDTMHYERSLPAARRAAQDRIEQAKKKPAIRIVVEEEGMVKQVYTMRAFMGRVRSNIEFCLRPDVEGSDDALVEMRDLVRGAERKGVGEGRVCRVLDASGKVVVRHRSRVLSEVAGLGKFF